MAPDIPVNNSMVFHLTQDPFNHFPLPFRHSGNNDLRTVMLTGKHLSKLDRKKRRHLVVRFLIQRLWHSRQIIQKVPGDGTGDHGTITPG